MRLSILFTLLVLLPQPSLAETCREKFVRLLTDGNNKGPVKIHLTQAIKGGQTSQNYSYQAGPGHWMTEMIMPANAQWTLVYNDVMYTSADKGKSWKKVRTLNSQQNKKGTDTTMQDAAKTVTNAACGSEDLNGVKHETAAADYTIAKFKTTHHDTYWVNPKTGWITKKIGHTKQSGFESTTTQLAEPAPGLKLPKPQ